MYGGYSRWDRRDVGLKPENALSRVAQLVEVGEVSDANQALYDIITDNQTRRRQWSKTYEGIMMKLMELSVELRQPAMVKEALHKYRAMCMQSNVSSLEDVVRFLVDLAEKRTEDARKSVDEAILEKAEDLEDEAMETPETLLLEAAGNALTKERIDRQQVVPWMRFLWEVYRVVVDIVKSHNKLEVCYHNISVKAFKFCLKYKRFMEFRRLCDMLRQHLNQLMNNTRNSPNDVKITDAETLQKFMETRFIQLSTAVTLEHWQEAYRTIEDIHLIMTLGKTKAKPQHMSIYYDKLMQVFWVSGNYLYHAHTLYKLYTLSVKQNRNLSAEDAQTMASRLVLAALSIPVYDDRSAMLSESYGVITDVLGSRTNENAARHARMAALLGYSTAAKRDPLISELLAKGVGEACHPELRDLYNLLEGEMAPLQFSNRIKKILDFVKSKDILKEYAAPLRRAAIFRLLEQLGRVYDVMRLDHMKKVADFAEYSEVEETALMALKTRSLAVRFDYQNQCLRFESELFSTDGMRTQLGRLARRMALTSKMLMENARKSAESASDQEVIAVALEKERKVALRRRMAIAKAKAGLHDEERDILRRREIIERRKEEAERRMAEAVKQKKLAAAREVALAEQRRKQEEAKRRHEEMRRQAEAPMESLFMDSVTRSGVIGGDAEEDAEREERMTREKEKELKEHAEMKKRILQLASHLNHMERATREEEWPLLIGTHEKEVTDLSKLTEEIASRELDEAKKNHTRALEDKGRTNRIMPTLGQYMTNLMKRVDKEFESWARKERERADAQAAREAEQAAIREAEEAREREQREEEERMAREKAEAEEREAAEAARRAREAAEREEMERRRAAAPAGKYVPGAFRRGKGGGGVDTGPVRNPSMGSAPIAARSRAALPGSRPLDKPTGPGGLNLAQRLTRAQPGVAPSSMRPSERPTSSPGLAQRSDRPSGLAALAQKQAQRPSSFSAHSERAGDKPSGLAALQSKLGGESGKPSGLPKPGFRSSGAGYSAGSRPANASESTEMPPYRRLRLNSKSSSNQ
ncbi:Translation initiation factor eIF-3 subunit A [Gracilaria domingensis]|nr:Translation initiation factor eIF-3 subunit A [Gracilaria domingensis]